MVLSGLRGDSMVLARARVPPCADVLRARIQLERALARADWRPVSLPAEAIVLVRRVAIAAREKAAAPFAERVALEVRRQASMARRPWLQSDLRDAEAVVFVDEAELMACLARDWLRGLVAQRWWWRSVLGDANPQAWLRREAIARPEVLVPAMSLLALRDEAAPFIARLDPTDCEQAFEAIVRSHAVPRVSALSADAPPGLPLHERGASAARVERLTEVPATEPIRRLVMEAPELRLMRSNPVQRRLLAIVLALIRAPTWARTEGFATALEALDHVTPDALASISPLPVEPVRDRPVAHATTESVTALDPRSTVAHAAEMEAVSQLEIPASHAPMPLPAGSTELAPESSIDIGHVGGAPAIRELVPGPVAGNESAVVYEARPTDPPVEDDRPRALVSHPDVRVARAIPAASSSLATAPRIETQFGGLFYLLNAALAMGLYGDFTAPLAKNLELSPWDWLALIGDRWFGSELRHDPAWTVLAELAGRTPEEEPDRDFHPPHKTWLAEHLATLHARLALAIGAEEGVDVPAFICRHDGAIELTATTVHVRLRLAALDLSIRIAGLDRDPGWIPAAGRSVRFHFD